MNPRDILSLAGACLLAVGGFLSQQPINSTPWWVGQIFVIIGPILMATRALTSTNQENKTINKAVDASTKTASGLTGNGNTTVIYPIPKTTTTIQPPTNITKP